VDPSIPLHLDNKFMEDLTEPNHDKIPILKENRSYKKCTLKPFIEILIKLVMCKNLYCYIINLNSIWVYLSKHDLSIYEIVYKEY
jgi:hypothetical protein